MKKILIISVLSLYSIFGFCQSPKIKVYILGTFHFNQVDSLEYDVRDDKHQKSIKKLSDIITNLRPEKVFVERMPEWEFENNLDSLYQEYRKGNLSRARNEVWQLGARVATNLNHSKLYSCDQPGLYGYWLGEIDDYTKKHKEEFKLEFKGKGMTIPHTSVVNIDSLRNNSELLNYMRWWNSNKVQSTSHAHYINVYPQIGNINAYTPAPKIDSTYYMGANLTVDWYRRNILTYSKMLSQLDYTEKAIFLIIGNDHAPIIKQLFRDNPYFELIETDKWLGKTKIKT
jgi:hypothetical protein